MKRLGGILVVGFGLGALLAVALHGQASYNPQPINFGSVKLGQVSPVMSSTLTNTGTDTLKFPGGSSMQPPTVPATGCSATGFCWVADNCSARAPGATCVLQYRFTPKSVGTLTGANVVMTNHGPFPLNFTGIGQDTVTASPPPPPSVVAGVRGNPVSVTLVKGSGVYVYAVAGDALGQPLGTPIVWSTSNGAVVTIHVPYGGVPQAAEAIATGLGSATLTASAGGKSTTIPVTVTAGPDTTPMSFQASGVEITNTPSPERLDFAPPRALWTGRFNVNVLGVTKDTVMHGWLTLLPGKP